MLISCCSIFPSSLWQPQIYLLSLWICLFWTFYTNEIIQLVTLCVWLLLLSIMFSSFIHAIAWIRISFLFMASNTLLHGYITFCLSTHEKVKVLVTQLCLTLGDPMNCSLPGSSVHSILQARILECVAICFSRGSSWSRDQTWDSRIASRFSLSAPPGKPLYIHKLVYI